MENHNYVNQEDLEKLIQLGRRGLLTVFAVLIIMLFHVLIDFFYHI